MSLLHEINVPSSSDIEKSPTRSTINIKIEETTNNYVDQKLTNTKLTVSNESVVVKTDKQPEGKREKRLERWEEMFRRLVIFREKHGHCLVPNRYQEDRQLGTWVSTQRRHYKQFLTGSKTQMSMTPDRAKRLSELGFDWVARDRSLFLRWESQFERLLEYVIEYGHALVPIGWNDDPPLANWVSTQRQEYKAMVTGVRPSGICQDRVRLLNAIGFVWEAPLSGLKNVRKAIINSKPANQSLSSIQKTAFQLLKHIRAKVPIKDMCTNLTTDQDLPDNVRFSLILSRQDEIPAKDNIDEIPAKDNIDEIPAKDNIDEIPAKDNIDEIPAKDNIDEIPTTDEDESPTKECNKQHSKKQKKRLKKKKKSCHQKAANGFPANQMDTMAMFGASSFPTTFPTMSPGVAPNFGIMASSGLQPPIFINTFPFPQQLPNFGIYPTFPPMNFNMNQFGVPGFSTPITAMNTGMPFVNTAAFAAGFNENNAPTSKKKKRLTSFENDSKQKKKKKSKHRKRA